MAAQPLTADAIEAVARDDVALACEQARALVAADPSDEQAASLLSSLASRLGAEAATAVPPPAAYHPAVAEAVRLLGRGEDEQAEVALRAHLREQPGDVAAMRLMGQIALNCGFPADAERIARRAIEKDPASADSWALLGRTLYRGATASGSVAQVDRALDALSEAVRRDPLNEAALSHKASILVNVRRLDEAEAAFEQQVRTHPASSIGWTNYAFLLKTVGRFGEAVAAYRTSAALDPANGPAWWGLANLKTASFFADDIAAMEQVVASGQLSPSALVDVHFALAHAYDTARDYERAAKHFDEGNALRRQAHPHNAEAVTRNVDRTIANFTREFAEARRGQGFDARDPIFILGMPRSGSTLVEQILASHSEVEGTEELFVVQQVFADILARDAENPEALLAQLNAGEWERMGRRYLQLAGLHRKTERPRFTDKNPGNWRHVGMIHFMLPNAKIIDIRRNPMDCCFANYAQHFMGGGSFTYSQSDIAHYYRDYVRLMRHIDAVLPGRVHRIIYEDLVENLEGEVRRLLDYLELPFEPACLSFHETERAVHTPSSEQVRQPINRAGVGRWERYEPWLGELKNELGDVAAIWRD